MKQFQFPLEPLLVLRRTQRDACRRVLAQALSDDSRLAALRSQTQARRRLQLDELRSLQDAGRGIRIEASLARRSFAAELSGELKNIDDRRADLARQIDVARRALLRADQAVKGLEKLSDQKLAEFVLAEGRKEAIEREQTWLAVKATAEPKS